MADDGEFGDDLSPEEEAEKADLTVFPQDWREIGWFIHSYWFPYWETAHECRYLELAARGHTGEDSWVLLDGRECYNKRTRRWEYEMRPTERDDKFLRDCRMTLGEARLIVPRLVVEMNLRARRRVTRIIRNYRHQESLRAQREEVSE